MGSSRIGTEEQNEWYFFSHKDKKYPTGTRTNRATAAGFWKATGRDKAIYSKQDLVGMRKTLVFYKGRAPNASPFRKPTNDPIQPNELLRAGPKHEPPVFIGSDPSKSGLIDVQKQ
ncbi:hypothetical protein RD792_006101 [Penstemon davidsonii]|uniref:NAC domain-containing protein n=1 Tax=Penstemon davidsonii TaxID=160366 RepID=A0ABR0DDN9_9LAMI|nr:hypothetical protein RD792_006101 [Penstemon davidsonii]